MVDNERLDAAQGADRCGDAASELVLPQPDVDERSRAADAARNRAVQLVLVQEEARQFGQPTDGRGDVTYDASKRKQKQASKRTTRMAVALSVQADGSGGGGRIQTSRSRERTTSTKHVACPDDEVRTSELIVPQREGLQQSQRADAARNRAVQVVLVQPDVLEAGQPTDGRGDGAYEATSKRTTCKGAGDGMRCTVRLSTGGGQKGGKLPCVRDVTSPSLRMHTQHAPVRDLSHSPM